MSEGHRLRQIVIATVVVGVIALVLLIILYQRDNGGPILSLKTALRGVLVYVPMLFFAFIIAEAIEFVIHQDTIANWVGPGSGLKGILLGSAAGSLFPYCCVTVPVIAAAFLRAGATTSTTIAFMTGLALIGLPRLPIEAAVVGWRFALFRLASSFFLPVIAGLIASSFSRVKSDS